jgi:hypothetical protein
MIRIGSAPSGKLRLELEFHAWRLPCTYQLSRGYPMQNPAKFREYAEECRRLAEQATGKNRATLLIIAEAWTNCAAEAERSQKLREKTGEPQNIADAGESNSSPDGD